MEKEIWKPVRNYEGLYEISNHGRIKSLQRIILIRNKYPFLYKERLLKPAVNGNGYVSISLYINGVRKSKQVHQLVAIAFLNHNPNGHKLVINHKDFNKQNNNVENLEIVTNRENCNKKHLSSTSKYTGVHWAKSKNKWRSMISKKGVKIHLGYFTNELNASKAYENSLKSTPLN